MQQTQVPHNFQHHYLENVYAAIQNRDLLTLAEEIEALTTLQARINYQLKRLKEPHSKRTHITPYKSK